MYRSYLQTAENNIDRRLQMHRFFFSIVAGIAIAYGFMFGNSGAGLAPSDPIVRMIVELTLCFTVVVMSLAWLGMTLSFRRLSRSKYSIISQLEENIGLPLHTEEWQTFRQQQRGISLTLWEMIPPVVFALVAVIILMALVFQYRERFEQLFRL